MIDKLVRTYHIEDTVVVAGSPRSGTTWLGSLVSRSSGYRHRDEPLDLCNSRTLREMGFGHRMYLSPEGDHPDCRTVFEHILTGRTPGGRPNLGRFHQIADVFNQLFEDKLVVKFIRANRLLRWMARQFDTRGFLYIVRHPCAVVSSQLRYDDRTWRASKPPSDVRTGFGGKLPDFILDRFGGVLSSLSTTEDVLAAHWCLDQYFPLYEGASPFPGLIVPYEKLVLDGLAELRRVFNHLGLEMPPGIEAEFHRPSTSASDDLRTHDDRAQVEKWTHQLSDRQIDDILGIVDAFGIDTYSHNPEPDYDLLLDASSQERA
jgi:LPS sulfotransferase NodH